MRPEYLSGERTCDGRHTRTEDRIRSSGHVRSTLGEKLGKILRERHEGSGQGEGRRDVQFRPACRQGKERQMKIPTKKQGFAAVALALGAAASLQAHHSFAAYDMTKTQVLTGVVTRVNPDANHLQIFFAAMNPERKNVERDKDGKPIIWSVEMAGSAASA